MSLCIDRSDNIIINQGGTAHRTGWVIVRVVKDFQSMEVCGLAVARGQGRYTGGMYRTTVKGSCLRIEGELSVQSFLAATGWTPGAR